jgi:hypothetical protein
VERLHSDLARDSRKISFSDGVKIGLCHHGRSDEQRLIRIEYVLAVVAGFVDVRIHGL